MTLDQSEARRLARLARLEYPRVKNDAGDWVEPPESLIDGPTLETLLGDMRRILDHVAQLQALNTDGVPPRTHGVPTPPVSRVDEPGLTLSRERFLAGSPQRSEDAVMVPKVVE